jgi:hypothetical protein
LFVCVCVFVFLFFLHVLVVYMFVLISSAVRFFRYDRCAHSSPTSKLPYRYYLHHASVSELVWSEVGVKFRLSPIFQQHVCASYAKLTWFCFFNLIIFSSAVVFVHTPLMLFTQVLIFVIPQEYAVSMGSLTSPHLHTVLSTATFILALTTPMCVWATRV